jgi:hypothetical protein
MLEFRQRTSALLLGDQAIDGEHHVLHRRVHVIDRVDRLIVQSVPATIPIASNRLI